jgi:transposase
MPRYTQARRTWHYLNEFKVKAVQLSLLEGVQVQGVAKTLDIHPFMLSRWRKEYREGNLKIDKRKKVKGMTKDKKELSRLKQLEKENARLKQENDLLKKWQRYLAETHQNDLDSSRDTDKTSE